MVILQCLLSLSLSLLLLLTRLNFFISNFIALHSLFTHNQAFFGPHPKKFLSLYTLILCVCACARLCSRLVDVSRISSPHPHHFVFNFLWPVFETLNVSQNMGTRGKHLKFVSRGRYTLYTFVMQVLIEIMEKKLADKFV